MRRLISRALTALGLTLGVLVGTAAISTLAQGPIIVNPAACRILASDCLVITLGGATWRPLEDRAADLSINVKDGFTAVVDGSVVSVPGARGATILGGIVSCTTNSPNITVANATFTPADVGKRIFVADCATGPVSLVSTILSVQSYTEITTVDNATRTFSGADKRVVYGYDDSARITAIKQLAQLTNGGTSVNSRPIKFFFPGTAYIIESVPVDFTDLQQAQLLADGVTFYCATNGAPCFDAYGFYNGVMRGFTMIGDSALPPSYAVQVGRYKELGAFGLSQYQGLFLTGNYTRAVWYNSAAEAQTFFGGTFESKTPGTVAFVGDGNSSHTLWPAPSIYVEVTTVDKQHYSNSLNLFLGTRFLVDETDGVALWLRGINKWKCDTCYLVALKHNIVFDNVEGQQGPFEFSGAFDGPAQFNVWVERDSSTNINGLSITSSVVVTSGQRFFGTTDLASVVSVRGATLNFNEVNAGGGLFDRAEDWAWYGNITTNLPRDQALDLPATFVGTVSEVDQDAVTYGVLPVTPKVQVITAASDTIVKQPNAIWVELALWGAGGPGGSGIACGTDLTCSGGSGGGSAGQMVPTAPILWADLPCTTMTVTVAQSVAPGGGQGGSTTVDCGSITWRAYGGGSGGNGTLGAIAAGGGGGTTISTGGNASGTTAGSAASGGAGAGGSTTTGGVGASGQGSGGGASNVSGVAGSGGNSAHGATGGGAGGPCLVGEPQNGNGSGSNALGFVSEGIPGTAGRAGRGTSGTGGAGGNASKTTGGAGGAGGTPGGGGGGGGNGCDGVGTPGVGGNGGGGMVIARQSF